MLAFFCFEEGMGESSKRKPGDWWTFLSTINNYCSTTVPCKIQLYRNYFKRETFINWDLGGAGQVTVSRHSDVMVPQSWPLRVAPYCVALDR